MDKKLVGNEKNILFYNDAEGNTKVEVILENEDVWLNTEALATLFNIDRSGIVRHINNIYKDEELDENSTCAKIAHMGNDGKQTYNTKYYNLDMIISIGFRVNSKKAIKFRTWANKIIKEYMAQGFSLNDERFLKAQKSDQEYFKRLLDRIKLIRTNERMFYKKITDIFAECSINYDKNSDTAITFYKTIQNKFHYAITGNNAAEIVYHRADSEKENMGLTTWKNEVENALKVFQYEVLEGKGRISHKQVITKAENEYEKYKVIQDKNYVSDFDRLLNETKQIENK